MSKILTTYVSPVSGTTLGVVGGLNLVGTGITCSSFSCSVSGITVSGTALFRSGITSGGYLSCSTQPTSGSHLANKEYVDARGLTMERRLIYATTVNGTTTPLITLPAGTYIIYAEPNGILNYTSAANTTLNATFSFFLPSGSLVVGGTGVGTSYLFGSFGNVEDVVHSVISPPITFSVPTSGTITSSLISSSTARPVTTDHVTVYIYKQTLN